MLSCVGRLGNAIGFLIFCVYVLVESISHVLHNNLNLISSLNLDPLYTAFKCWRSDHPKRNHREIQAKVAFIHCLFL